MKAIRHTVVWVGIAGVVLAAVLAVAINNAFAEGEGGTGEPTKRPLDKIEVMSLAFSAALAAGVGCLGGGYAVARVGAAALGAASERPELLVRSLVFVALGEGIAIFGLVVSIMMILELR
jgi:V/A-type H+-transporting ATPase subunit K